MSRKNCLLIFLIVFQTICAKDVELPPCPLNIAYFPQNLPMHCKMVTGQSLNSVPIPMKSTYSPSIFNSPPPGKVPPPMPFPVPPFPPPMFPPGMVMPPMGPMPIAGAPPQKMPVIVMPFYSPDPVQRKNDKDKKKKPKKKDSDDSESCSDDSSDESSGFWRPGKFLRKRRGHKRSHSRFGGGFRRNNDDNAELLTPMIQYVTKDGYVIYEKEISKGEAKSWLRKNKKQENSRGVSYKELDEIKHGLDEDNVVVDYVEPKFIRAKVTNPKEARGDTSSNIPTTTHKVHRKKFKRIEK